MLTFACFVPHAQILLPNVGSAPDREKVRATINSLESLVPKLAAAKPEIVIITSPHPDWGINVPLSFLIPNFKFQISNQFQISNDKLIIEELKNSFENLKLKIENSAVFPILTSNDSLKSHYELGKQIARILPEKRQIAWIASGDMSHTLKEDGPYGFNPNGPVFDQQFIKLLKDKNVTGILNLDQELIDQAGVCGIWSFCMLLGALDELKINWEPDILSYEGPFGVGYLVTELKI